MNNQEKLYDWQSIGKSWNISMMGEKYLKPSKEK